MENNFDFCARRAAEEFVAANRAATAEQRKHHRQLAEQYADLVRTMLQAQRDAAADEACPAATAEPMGARKAKAA